MHFEALFGLCSSASNPIAARFAISSWVPAVGGATNFKHLAALNPPPAIFFAAIFIASSSSCAWGTRRERSVARTPSPLDCSTPAAQYWLLFVVALLWFVVFVVVLLWLLWLFRTHVNGTSHYELIGKIQVPNHLGVTPGDSSTPSPRRHTTKTVCHRGHPKKIKNATQIASHFTQVKTRC